jgi:hypothetical protein
VDRCEARVAGASAIAATLLEVIEERANQRGIEVLELECGRLLCELFLDKSEQQTKRIAVGRDGVRTHLSLPDQAIREEAFE